MASLVDTFSNRLKYAITIKNIKPIELSRKTGISKANISYYMSGKYEPKQDGLISIANALNIDPVWLLGYDVPMERTSKKQKDNILYTSLTEKIKSEYGSNSVELLNYYNQLNNVGQNKILENAQDLTKIPEYTNKNDEKERRII